MLHFNAMEPFDRFTRQLIFELSQGYDYQIELAGTAALHDMALQLNWDAWSEESILWLAARPDVSRATVLLLYWRGGAGFYLQYADRSEVSEFQLEGYNLSQALEQVFLDKPGLSDGIGFDPRHNNGTDWTTLYDDLPRRRAAPAHMLRAVPGVEREPLGDFEWDGRAPTMAEREAVAAGIARGRALLPGLAPGAAGREVILAIEAAMRTSHSAPGPATDDLAWLWLDQLGWAWGCSDNRTDGVLLGSPDCLFKTAR